MKKYLCSLVFVLVLKVLHAETTVDLYPTQQYTPFIGLGLAVGKSSKISHFVENESIQYWNNKERLVAVISVYDKVQEGISMPADNGLYYFHNKDYKFQTKVALMVFDCKRKRVGFARTNYYSGKLPLKENIVYSSKEHRTHDVNYKEGKLIVDIEGKYTFDLTVGKQAFDFVCNFDIKN